MTRFDRALASIDRANSEDPTTVRVDGAMQPAELVYSQRMTSTLTRFRPDASEALQLAARAQHLKRWTVPRETYPMDRAGYHRWRNDLKRRHAEWAGVILLDAGYDAETIARVASLIRKENLKADAEAQTLEDVACLVFLEHYSAGFAAKHEDAKLIVILQKTWAKMSPAAHSAALALPLSPRIVELVQRATKSGEPQ